MNSPENNRNVRKAIGVGVVASLIGVGVGLGLKSLESSDSNAAAPNVPKILALAKSPGASSLPTAKSSVIPKYEVTFNKGGSVWGVTTSFAKAEGQKDPSKNEMVSEEVNEDTRDIAMQVSPNPDGTVNAGQTIYVRPVTEIVDPQALMSYPGATITMAR